MCFSGILSQKGGDTMLTPVQAQCFEFLMWKSYRKLGKAWDKKLLISSDGQLFTGNFLNYDETSEPSIPSLNAETDWVSLGHANRHSQNFYQLSKKLHEGRLKGFADDANLDALISMYVLDTLKSSEETKDLTGVSPVMLLRATSLTNGQEYPFILLGDHVNILSVVD